MRQCWTMQMDARLRERLGAGDTAAEAGRALGMTRNAVIGRARLEGQRGHGDGTAGRPLAHRSVAAADVRRNGSFWSGADWLACHDGKARRAEPGLRLLADGMLGRVDAWRLAGNGLVLPLATEVVGALMDYLDADARAS